MNKNLWVKGLYRGLKIYYFQEGSKHALVEFQKVAQ